jgi:mono/diheme cytochrome c family protein
MGRRIKRLATSALVLAFVAALIFWPLTSPLYLSLADLPVHLADPVNGERMLHAGGCTACHGEGLGGGLVLESDFGAFHVPNISPDPGTGIGNWSELDLVNAMMLGSSPGGKHYYPSFPYTSYTRMKVQDIMDLKAYLDTLQPVDHAVAPHDLRFPWSFRRAVGLWKLFYLKQGPVVSGPADDPVFDRGRYLVEGAGHCGECHTPRNRLGGLRLGKWLTGGPNPDGEGRVPNITPDPDGLGSWSESDITYYLESGFTPDFDTVGGSMVKVQEHMALLPAEDREAIAAYLKSIPARR